MDFKFCTHISKRMLNKKEPLFFSDNESFFFLWQKFDEFERVFRMKAVTSNFFRKYSKRRKSQAWFCLFLG